MAFVLILSIWTNLGFQTDYYRFEMSKNDCESMLKVIDAYPKLAAPSVHGVCVPKEQTH